MWYVYNSLPSWKHKSELWSSLSWGDIWKNIEKCYKAVDPWSQDTCTWYTVSFFCCSFRWIKMKFFLLRSSYAIRWQEWVNVGSDNSLLPAGTKPLPEPMLAWNQMCSVVLAWEQCYKKCSRTLCIPYIWRHLTMISLKFTTTSCRDHWVWKL